MFRFRGLESKKRHRLLRRMEGKKKITLKGCIFHYLNDNFGGKGLKRKVFREI